jgi:hypothetical protein
MTYDVVVSVENSDLSLKPGMTAATAIVTESREEVTRVPDQALRCRAQQSERRSRACGRSRPTSPRLPALAKSR